MRGRTLGAVLIGATVLLPAAGHAAWQEQALLFAQQAVGYWRDGAHAAVAWGIDTGTPLLRDWITASRDRALAAGTAPIPAPIRLQLTDYMSETTLRRVRFRVGFTHESAAPAQLFRMLRVRAVTFDYVIVFRDEEMARDPVLWAHELAHVEQYRRWGVEKFAMQYLSDRDRIESEAWDAAARYKMWALQHGRLTTAAR